ncbi:MAG: hypothetical protein D6688_03525 [Alphaproteobacteria bacterium]|nr:MAG: hypothetical protein D6688_03525 [Alphaproteobacteria bacterium]
MMVEARSPDGALSCTVYPAGQFRVVLGANAGDPLGPAEFAVPGDIFQLDPVATPAQLRLVADARTAASGVLFQGPAPGTVAQGSEVGRPGAPVHPVDHAWLMSDDGTTTEVIVLRSEARTGAPAFWALPLGPVEPGCEYTLLKAAPRPVRVQHAEATSVGLGAGTRITMADGRQVPIEALARGDRILSRDRGPVAIRRIISVTHRAHGEFAPVILAANALGNADDLILSPHHRLYVFRRGERAGLDSPEVLIPARDLVDGMRARRRRGGFVTYYNILLEHHDIIYAEGIPVESFLATPARVRTLAEQDRPAAARTGPRIAHRAVEVPGNVVFPAASAGPFAR